MVSAESDAYITVGMGKQIRRGTGTKLLENVLLIKRIVSYVSNHESIVYQNWTPTKRIKHNLNKCILCISAGSYNGVLSGSGVQLIVTRSAHIYESWMFHRNVSYILYKKQNLKHLSTL